MSEDISVDDLVSLVRNPGGEPTENTGACVFAQTVAKLPPAYQEALELTLPDKNVRHADVVAFINNHTDERVSLSAVQRHRNKRGCTVCSYGVSR